MVIEFSPPEAIGPSVTVVATSSAIFAAPACSNLRKTPAADALLFSLLPPAYLADFPSHLADKNCAPAMHKRIKNKNSANPTANAFAPYANASSSLFPIDCSYKTNSRTTGKIGVITTVNPSTIAAKLIPYPCTHFTRNQQSTSETKVKTLAAAHTVSNDEYPPASSSSSSVRRTNNQGMLGKHTIVIASDIVHSLPK